LALSLVVLGDAGPAERLDNLEIRFIPYERNLQQVARYYQAADLYLHGAKAETAPLTILEALATGLPVVATAVGGVAELVRSLAAAPGAWTGAAHPLDRATGVLVAPGDADGMGAALAALLGDETLLRTLSANAIVDVADRFDFERYVDTTLAWYWEVLGDWRARRDPGLQAARSSR
jgi:glycosyltransferase involved in cell wall biosynthesis